MRSREGADLDRQRAGRRCSAVRRYGNISCTTGGTRTRAVACFHSGVVDEDAVHGRGRSGEEVAAAVPVRRLLAPTSLRYASWTRAVGWRVWPAGSFESRAAASLRSSAADFVFPAAAAFKMWSA